MFTIISFHVQEFSAIAVSIILLTELYYATIASVNSSFHPAFGSFYFFFFFSVYDSSAKIPSGIITGNIKQLGNYDECLRVTNSFGFTGQACTASVRFDVHSKPVSSNDLDMKDLLSSIALASVGSVFKPGINLRCKNSDENKRTSS